MISIELQLLCIQIHTKAPSIIGLGLAALAPLSQPLSFSYGTRGAIRFYSGLALYRGSDPLTGRQVPKRLVHTMPDIRGCIGQLGCLGAWHFLLWHKRVLVYWYPSIWSSTRPGVGKGDETLWVRGRF